MMEVRKLRNGPNDQYVIAIPKDMILKLGWNRGDRLLLQLTHKSVTVTLEPKENGKA